MSETRFILLILWLSTLMALKAADRVPEPARPATTGEQKQKDRERQSEKRNEQNRKLTDEEREAKRKEIKGRLEKRLVELRTRETNGILTSDEKRSLRRCEQVLKRFEQSGVKGEKAPEGKEKKGRSCEHR